MTRNYTALVSFETAKRLKEAGYTKDYGYQYDANGELTDPAAPGGYEGVCEAPTYADIFDWLMEKGIRIGIIPFYTISANGNHYSFMALIAKERCVNYVGAYVGDKKRFDSFSEAATAAVEEAIEILNEK